MSLYGMSMQAQRGGGEGIPATPLQPRLQNEVGGQHQAPDVLIPGKTWHLFYRRLVSLGANQDKYG